MSGLAHGKPLLGIDSGNNFTSSRASSFKRVLPVFLEDLLLDIFPYESPWRRNRWGLLLFITNKWQE